MEKFKQSQNIWIYTILDEYWKELVDFGKIKYLNSFFTYDMLVDDVILIYVSNKYGSRGFVLCAQVKYPMEVSKKNIFSDNNMNRHTLTLKNVYNFKTMYRISDIKEYLKKKIIAIQLFLDLRKDIYLGMLRMLK